MVDPPDHRAIRDMSMMLAPLGILLAAIWLLVMYTLAVNLFPHAFGVHWPNPINLVPPGWRLIFMDNY